MSSSGVSGNTGASFAVVGGSTEMSAPQDMTQPTIQQQQQFTAMQVDVENASFYDDQRQVNLQQQVNIMHTSSDPAVLDAAWREIMLVRAQADERVSQAQHAAVAAVDEVRVAAQQHVAGVTQQAQAALQQERDARTAAVQGVTDEALEHIEYHRKRAEDAQAHADLEAARARDLEAEVLNLTFAPRYSSEG